MRVFIEWRNSVGGQLASCYAQAGDDATRKLQAMIYNTPLHAGDSFHIFEVQQEPAGELFETERQLDLADRKDLGR